MLTKQSLIDRYIELDPERPSPSEARLRDAGIHVWALIGHYLFAVGQDLTAVARDYDLPEEAVAAALAFYQKHRHEIDTRLAQNKSPHEA